MRLLTLLCLLLLIVSPTFAQLTVTSWSPVDGATSVPTTTTVSFTFSAPVDTTVKLGDELGLISNIDTITAQWYSADRRTAYFNTRLAANRVYFVCVYWAPGDGGANIAIPQLATFTTASAYPSPAYSVSGTVSGGSTGVSPAYSLVALSDGPMMGGKPNILMGTVANASGVFSFSGIPAGTYWPLAIRDYNADGYLDPSDGDPIALGDSIVVLNAPITGISLTFTVMGPISFHEALDKLTTQLAPSLPSDKLLHLVYCWDLDTTGLASSWSFYYSSASTHKYYNAEVGTMDLRADTMDTYTSQWFKDWKPMTSPETAARPESVIVRTENAGGRTWRATVNPGGLKFKMQMLLGYIRNSQFSGMAFDTSKFFWGVEYQLGTYPRPDSFAQVFTKRFVADYSTGTIVSFTGVDDHAQTGIPAALQLDQNYPNPFNPTTVVSWQLSAVSMVRLSVYDLLGREVAVLTNEQQEPGAHSVTWHAHGMASGVYYYRLEAGSAFEMKKMVLVR
jgi:hypothetical protein